MQFFAPALYTAGRADRASNNLTDRACTQSFAPALRRSQVLYIPKHNKLTFLSVTDTYVHTHIRTYVRTYAYSENVTRSRLPRANALGNNYTVVVLHTFIQVVLKTSAGSAHA